MVDVHSSAQTPEQLRRHYEVEKELAAMLRNAGPDERLRHRALKDYPPRYVD